MKRMLLAALLGTGLLLLSGQQASAWHKCRLSVGLNFCSEGGGNTWLCGLFKGANPPPYAYGAADGGVDAPAADFTAPLTDPGHAAPQSQLLMPRATTQRVSYVEEQKVEDDNYYAPSYWYGR
jgi:hypothetical protein